MCCALSLSSKASSGWVSSRSARSQRSVSRHHKMLSTCYHSCPSTAGKEAKSARIWGMITGLEISRGRLWPSSCLKVYRR